MAQQRQAHQAFTEKAHFYQHRWDYAPAAIEAVSARLNGCAQRLIADLGAGNGALGRHFVRRGATVIAIEPNWAMLSVAEPPLNTAGTQHTLCATAEATGLRRHSVDAVVIGRALHWFAPEEARQEIRRILKPGGLLAILRVPPADQALQDAINQLRTAEHGWDMRHGGRRPPIPPHRFFYGEQPFDSMTFDQQVEQDWTAFWGYLCSRSAAPDPAAPQFDHFQRAAERLFAQISQNGRLRLTTRTELSLGTVSHD